MKIFLLFVGVAVATACVLLTRLYTQETPHVPTDPVERMSEAFRRLSIVNDRTHADDVVSPLPTSSLSLDAFLREHPRFVKLTETGVTLRGTHVLREDIVIPRGISLTIAEGSTLWLGSGVSLVAGGQVFVRGTEEAPVTVRAIDDDFPWGSFVLSDVSGESRISWTEFRDGGASAIADAMVSIESSSVTIADTIFRLSSALSALTLTDLIVSLDHVTFRDNAYVGLTVRDVPAGAIRDADFLNNTAVGLDLSQAPIEVSRVRIEGSGICLRASKRSTPAVLQSRMKACGIGLVAQDDAHVAVMQSAFIDNGTAVVASLTDPLYQPPTVSVINTSFSGNIEHVIERDGAAIAVDRAYGL